MKTLALNGVATLREQYAGRAKFTKVNRVDYFRLLVTFDQVALSDKESYEAWKDYHLGRGENIRVRRLHLRKLLEKYDARGRY